MAETTIEPTPGHDFDFLFGEWRIVNEYLSSRLSGSTDWERFEAKGSCRPVLGGLGNVDDFRPIDWSSRAGYVGGALRLFNPTTGKWTIYWFDNISYTLQPPVHGSFTDGVGEFFGDDLQDGVPVLVRFHWSNITATGARWEQAFSTDNGATWELNWIMTFIRTES